MRRFSRQGCWKGDTNSQLPFTVLCPPVLVSTCDVKSALLFPGRCIPLAFLSLNPFQRHRRSPTIVSSVLLGSLLSPRLPSGYVGAKQFSVCALCTLHYRAVPRLVSTTHSTLFTKRNAGKYGFSQPRGILIRSWARFYRLGGK